MEVTDMVFSEIYGSYYNTVTAILSEAVTGELTADRISDIIRRKAFAESVMTIPSALKSGEWPFLKEDMKTPLRNIPIMPLTLLERRWLKAIYSDPRIRLFDPPPAGLEDVEPLFTQDMLVYYDRYKDGDPYGDENYMKNFRTVLSALHEKRKMHIDFLGQKGKKNSWECIPHMLEYSAKDDKFRLSVIRDSRFFMINAARITACEVLGNYAEAECICPQREKAEVVLELTDERNALERIMIDFSHFEKETEKIDDCRYRITVRYFAEDATELLIRIMSFGPVIKAVYPDPFIDMLKKRLDMQKATAKRSRK